MRSGMRGWRVVLVVVSAVVALSAAYGAGPRSLLDGVLYDLTVLAASSAAPVEAGAPAPVVVIAFDARSLEATELAATPRVFMAPFWARLLDGLFENDTRLVAFDAVFSYSANRFLPGYDLPFLAALGRHRGRVVLARSATTTLAQPYHFVMPQAAIGFVEMGSDSDGVFRYVATRYKVEGAADRWVPTLNGAAVALAGAPRPPEEVLLAPRAHVENQIPTYSLIDVLRCIETDPAMVRAAFAGATVFLGTTLPEEDRKTGPDRFLPTPVADLPPVNPPPAGCVLPTLGASDPSVSTVPGVHLHALAADQVLRGHLVRPVPETARVGATAAAGAIGALLGLILSPWAMFAIALAFGLVLFGGGVLLFILGVWLPTAAMIIVMPVAGGVAYAARYLAEERLRQSIQTAFGHYLAPSLVDRLAQSGGRPALGGETRDVTVMFADLSGFTRMSGILDPPALMALTNRYLTHLVDAVEATGGYVDKFIGDAVMAIWGAPIAEPDHAGRAARAARDIVARVEGEAAAARERGDPGFAIKVGINSGLAVVGNVGAARRTNYTAVGETVNVAARLESLPGDYGCPVVLSEATRQRLDSGEPVLELDLVRVRGRQEPVSVFALLDRDRPCTAFALAYGGGLADYRLGRFEAARVAWSALAVNPLDGPAWGGVLAQRMAERAADLARDPPADWTGVWERTLK